MENGIVEEVVEEIAKKSFLKVIGLAFKKIFIFIVTFKWLGLLIKRSFRKTMKAKDLTIVELLYGLWIRIRWFILGIIGGYLLHYFEFFTKIDEWIQRLIDAMG